MNKKPIFCLLTSASDQPQIRRNYECPEYDDCLTMAAYSNFDLDCSDCPLKLERQKGFLLLTELEVMGCNSLLEAVFSPTRI
jgi:hypothetical protein